jgi:hypothetical protein
MTVKCKNCNNSFYIFWNGYDETKPIECPYCDCKLDQSYNRYIKDALGTTCELNSKIRSSHEDGYCDWFEFNIEEIYVPIEKFKSLKDR